MPTYTANAGLVCGSVTSAVSATHTKPTYAANVQLTVKRVRIKARESILPSKSNKDGLTLSVVIPVKIIAQRRLRQ